MSSDADLSRGERGFVGLLTDASVRACNAARSEELLALRELMRDSKWKDNAESQAFLKEAEELIEGGEPAAGGEAQEKQAPPTPATRPAP